MCKKLGSYRRRNEGDTEGEVRASQLSIGRCGSPGPCREKDRSTCSLHTGTGSQTSPEPSVATGTAGGRDWPAVPTEKLNCSERYRGEGQAL